MSRRRKINHGKVTWNVPDHVRRLYEELSKQFNMTYGEIGVFAKTVASLEIDPVEADGEAFSFERPLSGEVGPLHSWLGQVPLPNAIVDLNDASQAWKRDLRIATTLMDSKPTVDELTAVARNQKAWGEFWAVRWPKPEGREFFQSLNEEARADEARARQSCERQLKRIGIDTEARHATQN